MLPRLAYLDLTPSRVVLFIAYPIYNFLIVIFLKIENKILLQLENEGIK